MKKLIICIIIMCLVFLTTACSEPTTTSTLTKDNYSNFLIFEYEIENCVVNDKTYYCNIVVSTKSKKEAKFSDAELTFTLYCFGFATYNSKHITSNSSFALLNKYTIYIDEDGVGSTTVNMKSTTLKGFPSTNNLKLTVQKISGNVIY